MTRNPWELICKRHAVQTVPLLNMCDCLTRASAQLISGLIYKTAAFVDVITAEIFCKQVSTDDFKAVVKFDGPVERGSTQNLKRFKHISIYHKPVSKLVLVHPYADHQV